MDKQVNLKQWLNTSPSGSTHCPFQYISGKQHPPFSKLQPLSLCLIESLGYSPVWEGLPSIWHLKGQIAIVLLLPRSFKFSCFVLCAWNYWLLLCYIHRFPGQRIEWLQNIRWPPNKEVPGKTQSMLRGFVKVPPFSSHLPTGVCRENLYFGQAIVQV
jgi:hypothetical protein